jgi:hypothetical protein
MMFQSKTLNDSLISRLSKDFHSSLPRRQAGEPRIDTLEILEELQDLCQLMHDVLAVCETEFTLSQIYYYH